MHPRRLQQRRGSLLSRQQLSPGGRAQPLRLARHLPAVAIATTRWRRRGLPPPTAGRWRCRKDEVMELVTNAPSGAAGQVAPSVSARGRTRRSSSRRRRRSCCRRKAARRPCFPGATAGPCRASRSTFPPAGCTWSRSIDRAWRGSGCVRGSRSTATSGSSGLDSAPAFDAPPAADELLRLAARNHELEQTYHSARTAAALDAAGRPARTARARRPGVHGGPGAARRAAPSADAAALRHRGRGPSDRVRRRRGPRPGQGRGAGGDPPVPRGPACQARAEPAGTGEAARPARGEEAVRRGVDRGHDGTPEQQARQAAGVLPMSEASGRIADQAFAPAADQPVYIRDGLRRPSGSWCSDDPNHANSFVTQASVIAETSVRMAASASEWASVDRLQNLFPCCKWSRSCHSVSGGDMLRALRICVRRSSQCLKKQGRLRCVATSRSASAGKQEPGHGCGRRSYVVAGACNRRYLQLWSGAA